MQNTANTYAGIADYYDLLMTEGYYDYESQSSALAGLLNRTDRVLELGVGTGLLAERLLDLLPDISYMGVDNTEEMLSQARQRLGDDTSLQSHDAVTLNLGQEFDFAFSNGGVWYFIRTESGYQFCSHLPDVEDNFMALKAVASHVADGGRLVFSVQGPHEDYRTELPNGVVYEQVIHKVTDDCFDKHYQFSESGNCVADQMYRYRLFSESAAHRMLRDVGLDYRTTTECGQYREFVRV